MSTLLTIGVDLELVFLVFIRGVLDIGINGVTRDRGSHRARDTVALVRAVRTLLRRDPAFKDGEALLAALQWSQGSKEYSQTVAQLCNEPGWCARYSTVDVVMGRWTPRAVEAWRGLLQEKAVQRELKDGFARAR